MPTVQAKQSNTTTAQKKESSSGTGKYGVGKWGVFRYGKQTSEMPQAKKTGSPGAQAKI